MCWIAGAVWYTRNTVEQLVWTIAHRWPDAIGIYQHGQVTLWHARLSILDLSANANQPLLDKNNSVAVVFNWEIYNFHQLRKELEDLWYTFSTTTDTEILIHGWKEWNRNLLEKLDGFFAFCLYDITHQELLLARDKLWKKPLFYKETDTSLLFASEYKALLKVGWPSKINQQFMFDILNNWFTPRESAYEDIESLLPGHYMHIDLTTQKTTIQKFFDFIDLIDQEYYTYLSWLPTQNVLDEFERKFSQAVKKRFLADVQVWVICSWWLDSSLVTTQAIKHDTVLPLFHINVKECSELPYASLLAKKYNLPLHIREFDYNVFADNYKQTVYHMEYPLIHSNSIGISQVCSLAKETWIKVVLWWEWADELFGWYPHHATYYKLLKVSNLLPLWHKWRKFLQWLMMVNNLPLKSYFPFPTYQHALSKHRFEEAKQAYTHIRSSFEQDIAAFLYTDISEYLLPLLIRADRVSMAHWVEMRLPFLDIEIIKFALNLPLKHRMNRTSNKILIRKYGATVLPKEIITKPKVWFTMPYLHSYFKAHRDEMIDGITQLDMPKSVITYLVEHWEYNRLHRLYSMSLLNELLPHE